MLRMAVWAILIQIALLSGAALPSAAQDWPNETRLGPGARFHITDIKPQSDSRATGRVVNLAGFQPFPVQLSKDARDEITAMGKAVITGIGLRMDVDFRITNAGLEAKGSVAGLSKASGRPITDAVFTITPDGNLRNGTGRVQLGRYVVPCRYSIEGQRIRVEGSLSIPPAKKETAVASYTFQGNLAVRIVDAGRAERAVTVNCVGSVQRRGNLTGLVDTYGDYNEPVNPNNGQVKLNVAGVEVAFELW